MLLHKKGLWFPFSRPTKFHFRYIKNSRKMCWFDDWLAIWTCDPDWNLSRINLKIHDPKKGRFISTWYYLVWPAILLRRVAYGFILYDCSCLTIPKHDNTLKVIWWWQIQSPMPSSLLESKIKPFYSWSEGKCYVCNALCNTFLGL